MKKMISLMVSMALVISIFAVDVNALTYNTNFMYEDFEAWNNGPADVTQVNNSIGYAKTDSDSKSYVVTNNDMATGVPYGIAFGYNSKIQTKKRADGTNALGINDNWQPSNHTFGIDVESWKDFTGTIVASYDWEILSPATIGGNGTLVKPRLAFLPDGTEFNNANTYAGRTIAALPYFTTSGYSATDTTAGSATFQNINTRTGNYSNSNYAYANASGKWSSWAHIDVAFVKTADSMTAYVYLDNTLVQTWNCYDYADNDTSDDKYTDASTVYAGFGKGKVVFAYGGGGIANTTAAQGIDNVALRVYTTTAPAKLVDADGEFNIPFTNGSVVSYAADAVKTAAVNTAAVSAVLRSTDSHKAQTLVSGTDFTASLAADKKSIDFALVKEVSEGYILDLTISGKDIYSNVYSAATRVTDGKYASIKEDFEDWTTAPDTVTTAPATWSGEYHIKIDDESYSFADSATQPSIPEDVLLKSSYVYKKVDGPDGNGDKAFGSAGYQQGHIETTIPVDWNSFVGTVVVNYDIENPVPYDLGATGTPLNPVLSYRKGADTTRYVHDIAKNNIVTVLPRFSVPSLGDGTATGGNTYFNVPSAYDAVSNVAAYSSASPEWGEWNKVTAVITKAADGSMTVTSYINGKLPKDSTALTIDADTANTAFADYSGGGLVFSWSAVVAQNDFVLGIDNISVEVFGEEEWSFTGGKYVNAGVEQTIPAGGMIPSTVTSVKIPGTDGETASFNGTTATCADGYYTFNIEENPLATNTTYTVKKSDGAVIYWIVTDCADVAYSINYNGNDAVATVINTTKNNISAVLINAAYTTEKQLEWLDAVLVTGEAGKITVASCPMAQEITPVTAQAFLWNNLTNITPIIESAAK